MNRVNLIRTPSARALRAAAKRTAARIQIHAQLGGCATDAELADLLRTRGAR
jgi:hypothetical protein